MSTSTQMMWNTFVGDETPAQFMRRQGSLDVEACVQAYIRQLPHVHGIVRTESWRETFRAPEQYTRQHVATALRGHLEETRPEWEAEVQRALEQAAHAAEERAAARAAEEAAAQGETGNAETSTAEVPAGEATAAEQTAAGTEAPVSEAQPEAGAKAEPGAVGGPGPDDTPGTGEPEAPTP